MKVLMISGSPRKESNTDMALAEMKKIFDESGIECEVVKIGS
jgi:multimeric flavodoxin WrbA